MKSKTTAALLALFLGGFGMHKFYLGKPFAGFIYLIFFWTFIPAIIGFFEAILLFAMSDEKFQASVAGGADTHVKCPDCRELVLKDARVCKHCGCKLIPQQ